MRMLIKMIIVMAVWIPAFGEIVPVIDLDNSLGIVKTAVSPDGSVIYVAVSDGTLRKINPNTGVQTGLPLKFGKNIKDIAVFDGGAIILADRLYRVDNSFEYKVLSLDPGGLTAITTDRSGELIIGAKAKQLVFMKAQSSFAFQVIDSPTQIYSVCFHNAKRSVFAGGKDGIIYEYNIDTGKRVSSIDTHLGVIRSMAVSSRYLIAGGEKGVVGIDMGSSEIFHLSRHSDDVRSVSITPNGSYAVSGGDDTIPVLWALGSKQAGNIQIDTPEPVVSTAIDPYFRYVVVAATKPGETGGFMFLQYTSNKAQQRKTLFYRDATLTSDKVGHIDGAGLFGKYIFYTDSENNYTFNEVADIVHKPDKLFYEMPSPSLVSPEKIPAAATLFIDTAPPVISIDERGVVEISEEDILVITGMITDESGVEWAKVDSRPLSLGSNGEFKLEVAKNYDKTIVISAADIYGNNAERVIRLKAAHTQAHGKKTALLIGINRYKDLPALVTPEFDCRVLAEVLKTFYGYETRLLLGENATRDAILGELNSYRKSACEGDSLIIYFAGHGYRDNKTGNTYIQPYDSHLDEDTRWILTSQLTSIAAAAPVKNISIITDSCYVSGKDAKSPNNAGNMAVITSGSDEPVSDRGGARHSVFTGALIQALNNHRPSDLNELFKYTLKYMDNTTQTPVYIRLSGTAPEL